MKRHHIGAKHKVGIRLNAIYPALRSKVTGITIGALSEGQRQISSILVSKAPTTYQRGTYVLQVIVTAVVSIYTLDPPTAIDISPMVTGLPI